MSEIEMPEQQPNSEAVLIMYQVFLESLETHYSEIVRFLAILVPSLTGYGVALYQLNDLGYQNWFAPFTAVTIIVILVLTWGAWLGLAMSYRFRYLVITLSRIENHLNIHKLLPKTFAPKPIEKCVDRIMLRIAPEILKVHITVFIFVITTISIISVFILDGLLCLIVPGFGAVMLILLAIFGAVIYPNKYNSLLGN